MMTVSCTGSTLFSSLSPGATLHYGFSPKEASRILNSSFAAASASTGEYPRSCRPIFSASMKRPRLLVRLRLCNLPQDDTAVNHHEISQFRIFKTNNCFPFDSSKVNLHNNVVHKSDNPTWSSPAQFDLVPLLLTQFNSLNS